MKHEDPAGVAGRRLRRARADRDLALVLLLAEVALVFAGVGTGAVFAAAMLLTMAALAWAHSSALSAGRALVAAQSRDLPGRPPPGWRMDKGQVRALEMELYDGQVFHCFGHEYLVKLREEDGKCPECGADPKAPPARPVTEPPIGYPPVEIIPLRSKAPPSRKRDTRPRPMTPSVRDLAFATLEYASGPRANPREACRLIRKALKAIEDGRGARELDADGLDVVDELIEAYNGAEQASRRPVVPLLTAELVQAIDKAAALEARGHMTLGEAMDAHAKLCSARWRLAERRPEWEGIAPGLLVARAETLAARYADWLRMAGSAAVECPAIGDPKGCSPFVPGRLGGQELTLFDAAHSLGRPGAGWVTVDAHDHYLGTSCAACGPQPDPVSLSVTRMVLPLSPYPPATGITFAQPQRRGQGRSHPPDSAGPVP